LADGSYLLDRAGIGITAVLFCEGPPTAQQTALLDQLSAIDKRFVVLLIACRGFAPEPNAIADSNAEIARLFTATPGTFYLLRPDLHIAGRWKTAVPDEILRTANVCLGRKTL
jgi:3-(3-hydroxy-phenyl)propionate hydroxylase